MEINVPRPKAMPMDATVASEAILPIRKPAQVSMDPDVKMVGKDWFKVSTMASLIGITCFSCRYRLEITIA